MLSFEIDATGLLEILELVESRLPNELAAVAFDLGEEGERLVKESMTALIYSQPERGYERTEELLRSAYGYSQITAEGFDLVVGAVGGAEGREYAAPNETGSYSSRIDRDRLINDARAARDFAPKAYPRGNKGLEARPFVAPTVAQLERELEPRVQLAITRALT